MSRRNKNGFPSSGCSFPVGNNQICGETQTLEITKEFRKLYEEKMKQIQSGGDYESELQAKVNLQHNWIRDLTEQNEMLVRAVEELEMEATDRVAMLEEKLRNSAQVMQKYRDFNFAINLDETFQNLVYLQSDMRNLLEFIKRARNEGTWSINGLQFYNITCEDLFGSPTCEQGIGDQRTKKQLKIAQKFEQTEKMLRETGENLDRTPNETEALAKRLREKDQELNTLRRSMLDIRNALTIEVAEKHDVILNLRLDVQQLEEKYRQANKQTQFKDDIIKEMRKEIKLLKGQISVDASENSKDLRKQVRELEEENRVLKKQIADAGGEVDLMKKKFTATEQHEQDRRQWKDMNEALKRENAQNHGPTIGELKKIQSIESGAQGGSETINALQKELENVKNEHRKAQDQIHTLNAEIQAQNERIEELKQTLRKGGLESPYAEPSASTSVSQTSSTGNWSTSDANTHSSTVANLPNAIRRDGKLPQSTAELQGVLEKAQRDREIERAKHNQEIINLKQTISELEKALRNSQIRGESLQKTVDLYHNSVNVLEESEQRSRIEMSQLRQTILNLQEALVTSKYQLNELQQKASSEMSNYIQCINDLRNILLSTENQCLLYYKELDNVSELIEHLRDTNLDLAVENFGYIQDVAMLETRLLKYQHICKSNEECICGLNAELIKLRTECKHQLDTNNYLKQQLVELSCACQSMQNMEAESKELQKMLQRVNGDLHHQADITQQELLREAQLNDMKDERLKELQNIVGKKTMELNQCAGECCKIQQQLNLTIKQNQELKAELAQLKNQIENYRETAATNEKRAEYCQKEIENCKCNITDLSNRYMETKEQLQQKNEMCSKLEAELSAQNNNCLCLQKQIADNISHYEIDTSALRNIVTDLNGKLTKTESNYQILLTDYRTSQEQIIDFNEREAKLQQDKEKHEKELTETMQRLQNEELRLGGCICQIQTESTILEKELVDRERKLQRAREENINLKNEVNKILQRYNNLKAEHDHLHDKFDELCAGLSKTESRSRVTKEHFNECLCGLQNVHIEKDHLESKNKQLQTELEEVQLAYRDIELKYKKLNESVITLEMKLLDNNMCREEICAESRNVISNVRGWLQNQTTINEELTQKLRDDELLIENLKQQIAMSQSYSSNKKNCCCKIRQRGGGLSGDRSLRYVATRSQPDLWSPGSQGSGTVSPSSIVSNTQEWYTYEEFDEDYIEDDSLLSHCLKRVESINQELQKSNQFWQNKMMDHDYLVTRDQ